VSFCAWSCFNSRPSCTSKRFSARCNRSRRLPSCCRAAVSACPHALHQPNGALQPCLGLPAGIFKMDAPDGIAIQRAGICVQVLSFPAGIPRRTAACSCGAHPTQVRALRATGCPIDIPSCMLRHARQRSFHEPRVSTAAAASGRQLLVRAGGTSACGCTHGERTTL